MRKTYTRRKTGVILSVVLVFFAVAILFVPVLFAGIFLPPRYGGTYYGELSEMYRRLEKTEGKKIVVIGNSSVPFGVDSALCERLLKESGEDYSVCNFGLYGALGTKMMLDLSKSCMKRGDIVVFAPELTYQTLSLYFSAKEAWYALDGYMGLIWKFKGEDLGKLAGNYVGYAAGKYKLYRSGEAVEPSGIYARASFDERCDLTANGREYNVMSGGTDENNPIVLSPSLFDADFIAYVNSYGKDLRKRGVKVYYSFPPMNGDSMRDADPSAADELYSFIRDSFDFPVMSDIESRIMDKEYFYDSNFHLNRSGMILHTVNLVNDIKNQLGNTRKTEIVLPEKPLVPDESIEGEGDNSCAGFFTYRRDGNYYVLDGLTEEGAAKSKLIIPYQVNGLYVKGFLPSVFEGNGKIEEITLQENVKTVSYGSFSGCRNLKKIILTHEKPSDLSVGFFFLKGTNAKIYVKREFVNGFINDYFWGYYAHDIVGY